MALVPEPENIRQSQTLPGEKTYNSGVIAFCQGSPLLTQWAELSLQENDQFMGDQNALSRAIFLHRPPIVELPTIYNWKKNQEPNPNAVIIHYVASSKIKILLTLDSNR
jgi:hypothetical protein